MAKAVMKPPMCAPLEVDRRVYLREEAVRGLRKAWKSKTNRANPKKPLFCENRLSEDALVTLDGKKNTVREKGMVKERFFSKTSTQG